jgi:hypothetical protein
MMSLALWAVVAIFGPALPTFPTKLPTVLYAQISIPSLSEITQSILVSAPFLTVEAAISRMVAHGGARYDATYRDTYRDTYGDTYGDTPRTIWYHGQACDSHFMAPQRAIR